MTRYEQQLTALAVLQAHRAEDVEAISSLYLDSAPGEIYMGLLYLLDAFLVGYASKSGTTPQDLIDVWRGGLLYAAGRS